ncbi:hypothetical protein EUGRSUZ_A00874 [Eucalyptus grandis]|uniref:F-box domain-containing protein n=3 Tax=Eucalyptus grandis TaxID=71139 RepID=A0A059DD59_EUCGR|nr:hypothetical protein EUGRSUZ_A00874 [Eucalyptus grandis]
MATGGARPGSLTPRRRRRRTSAIAGDDAGEEVEQPRQEGDRISLLPNDVIHHILSFLPTADVFRTRGLSSRWRALHDAVPTLAFSLPGGGGGGAGRRGPAVSAKQFCAFVDAVLRLSRCTDLARFHLDLPYFTPELESELESKLGSWLSSATERRVKDLRVELPRTEFLYAVPRLVRDCTSLVELRLCGGRMGLKLPGRAPNWASLRVLSMAYLRLTDDEMGLVFVGSPALESLELRCCGGVARIKVLSRRMRELVIDGWKHWSPGDPRLEVSAPHLQTLRLRGSFPRMSLTVAEASSVAEAELNFSMTIGVGDRFDNYKWPRNLARGILQKLCNATEFVVGCWFLQVLSLLENGDLPPLLPNCKSLILNTRCQSLECHGILNMIESSPQVEKLVIKMIQPFRKQLEFDRDCKALAISTHSTHRYSGPLKRKNKLKCLDQHLRRVDIVQFDPRDRRSSSFLGLVEFILEEARVLDKMLINTCKVKDDGSNSVKTPNPRRLLEVSRSIRRHRRASENARVVLLTRKKRIILF